MAKKKKATPMGTIEVGKFGKIDDLELKPQGGGGPRDSIYDGVMAAMLKLKAGQQFTLDCPEGMTLTTFKNRLNTSLRRKEIKAPEGCCFRKRTTTDDRVAFLCLRIKDMKGAKKVQVRASAAVEKPAHPDAE